MPFTTVHSGAGAGSGVARCCSGRGPIGVSIDGQPPAGEEERKRAKRETKICRLPGVRNRSRRLASPGAFGSSNNIRQEHSSPLQGMAVILEGWTPPSVVLGEPQDQIVGKCRSSLAVAKGNCFAY